MSVPLPHVYHITSKNPSNESDESINCTKNPANIKVEDLFLTADERYEIFQIKAAERPHLLLYNPFSSSSHANKMDEKKSSGNNDTKILLDPPLIDGCDIPGWRKDSIVTQTKFIDSTNVLTINDEVQSLLNIGPSSTMFRLETQWPNIDKFVQSNNHRWKQLRKKLIQEPPIKDRAKEVEYDEYCQLIKLNSQNEHHQGMKATKFAIEFEQGNIPAKIIGATENWNCMPKDQCQKQSWTFTNLVKRFGHVYWRFSDTHGEMMSLKTYAKYISNIEGMLDDSPLGIYDAEFGDRESPTSEMTNEYTVPQCFSPDIFDLATKEQNSDEDQDQDDDENNGEEIDNRPPWRWILIGPERSGTGLHVDPLWTNAWVTVLQGKKRWCLFPPDTPKEKIGMDNGPQINSVSWFNSYYEKVTSADWPLRYKPVEVLQFPGETVFVPNGWPHLVLNLETTVAVTHNYASEFGPFERMWEEVKRDEPSFAKLWMDGMKKQRPDLYRRAYKCSLNHKTS